MGFITILITPDFYKDLIVRDHPASILHEVIQQAIFGRAQFDELAFQPDFTAVKVDLETIIHLNNVVHGAACSLGTADNRLHPADHLTWAERFGDVIIPTQFKAAYPIILLTLGRKHDHRDIACLTDGFQDIKPINIWHHDIQKN